jgi:hypothetical protein
VKKNVRPRFWFEMGLAVVTGLLAFITSVFPDWIESISGWDPDEHNGSVERLVVAGLLAVTIVMVWLAITEWRRALVRQR